MKLKMDVELEEKMDEIMELMHEITGYLIEFAELEISGKDITLEQIANNELIKTLFEKLQRYYRELQGLLEEEAIMIENQQNDYDDGYGDIATIKNKQNTIPIEETRIGDLTEYLKCGYESLNYITIFDEYTQNTYPSIYSEFYNIRNREYNLQLENVYQIENRSNMQCKNKIGKISFSEKSIILEAVARRRFIENYAINKVEQFIELFKNKYKKEPSKEIREKIEALIEQKYMLYFDYLNDKYVGILQENDKGKLALIKDLIDDGAEPAALNMTQYEIDRNIEYHTKYEKESFKNVLKSLVMEKEPEEIETSDKKDSEGIEDSVDR